MSIRGAIFPNQHPFASDHALVWQHCISDGLLYGCDMSFSARLFTIGAGFMIAGGRMFEITSAENISVSPGTGFARIYVSIDTGAASTETNFQQISFGVDYAASLESFPALTQEEINTNQGAAVYQSAVAIVAINSNGIVSIEEQMELVEAGSSTKLFAAIGVTYPEGSVLTCTDGKRTFTAKTTTGRWIFAVPYAATWTVTATDGTNSKSKTVEITGEGQFEIVNLAQVYIFKSGAGDDAAWEALFGGYAEAAITANKMTITGGSSVYAFSTVAVTTKSAVDLTEAKELVFDVQTDVAASTGVFAWVGAAKDKFERGPETSTISKANSTAYTDLSTTSRKEVRVDVSGLSGEYYIFAASDGMNINTDVYNVWLE